MEHKGFRIVDLSAPLENFAFEPWPPEITYWDHREGARNLGKDLGIFPDEFPGGMGLAWEELRLITHAGTHLDAPWHFGPTSEGKPAKTVDQVPLEWCYGDGVVLDLRHKKPGESITADDLKKALGNINYEIKLGDIVLIMTGADKYLEDPRYAAMHPGMTLESTIWLVEQGVKIIGTDGYGFDKPFKIMGEEHKKGVKNALWPAHFAGRIKEYCHIEKLANLEKIPKPHGFKVACFPIKIVKASAGWARVVAIIDE
ncbi:MAG: Kynurenine formamidase [Candidatus Bathyarchaeota archaeon BA1]|nr:MAG: Kynurenine formamidase [Candidatus Bathyarchaeota archaeon BA1]